MKFASKNVMPPITGISKPFNCSIHFRSTFIPPAFDMAVTSRLKSASKNDIPLMLGMLSFAKSSIHARLMSFGSLSSFSANVFNA